MTLQYNVKIKYLILQEKRFLNSSFHKYAVTLVLVKIYFYLCFICLAVILVASC